jgi:hypothetical protein
MASTIGTALGKTLGSCWPLAASTVSSPLLVRTYARVIAIADRLSCDWQVVREQSVLELIDSLTCLISQLLESQPCFQE